MTPQIAFLFALLAVMVYLFLTEKLPVDLTAFLGLIILIFTGYLTPGEAFTGFSSPAVITMLSVFIVGAALLETGVADVIGSRIHRLVGNSETRLIVVLMLTCGILSAFMNNIAATAVLMPAVATIAHRTGLSPSRLFMPRLGTESDPDDITSVWRKRLRTYHISSPSAGPVSHSRWMFRSSIPASSSSKLHLGSFTGVEISAPSFIINSRDEPGCSPISSAYGLGIRIPRLFPHF